MYYVITFNFQVLPRTLNRKAFFFKYIFSFYVYHNFSFLSSSKDSNTKAFFLCNFWFLCTSTFYSYVYIYACFIVTGKILTLYNKCILYYRNFCGGFFISYSCISQYVNIIILECRLWEVIIVFREKKIVLILCRTFLWRKYLL